MDPTISFLIHDLEPALASFSCILKLLKNKKLNTDNRLHQNLIESSDLALSYARNLLETLLEQGRMEKKEIVLIPSRIIWEKDYPEMTALSRVLAFDKSIELITKISGNNLETTSDRKLLQRILNNLLINAIQYSPAHSRVLTTIRKKDETTRISIQDEGTGFAKLLKNEEKIPAQGFGMGLDFCKEATKVLGGTLSIKKNSSRGVCIELKIKNYNKICD